MPSRDTAYDGIDDELILRYVTVLQSLSGWGVKSDGSKAVYPNLSTPMPQNPYPMGYVYLGGVDPIPKDGVGTGYWEDTLLVNIRILGGPATPGSIVPGTSDIPEQAIYKVLHGVLNVLRYRRYLEDPTNGDAPFRNIAPDGKLTVGKPGPIRPYNYGELGAFVGLEVPTQVTLLLHVGRLS